ncbi:hypothetical protein EYF80_031130 [Liparis tanakae]|uniref:Uncharacterized protein n=1 Tax=Liparis tanakae TaxID=230148 RepID=A0A4Z2GY98_9TELE|nr:hypothetical protein EYF80_031130 [Liparis tanakae]
MNVARSGGSRGAARGGKKTESESKQVHNGGLASDLASGDTTHSGSNTALSLADMQKLLASKEERIINTLTAQILANHGTMARHDQTSIVQQIGLTGLVHPWQTPEGLRVTVTLQFTLGRLLRDSV